MATITENPDRFARKPRAWRRIRGMALRLGLATIAMLALGTTGYTQVITEFAPGLTGQPDGIVSGSDGKLWFSEFDGKIGTIKTDGTGFVEFTIPSANASTHVITAGPDGNLWFTEDRAGRIGRITTAGTITEFCGLPNSSPLH